MARPATIRDETILEAAREVFLSRGVQGTTAEVAERAGVSEGTLFKRFRTKDELFRAAMTAQPQDVPWIRSLPGRVGRGDVQETLVDLGLEMVDFFRLILPLMMMTFSNPSTKEAGPFPRPNPPPLVALGKLTEYFRAEVALGRIRAPSPEIAARAFMAGLHSFVMMQMVLKGHPQTMMEDREFVRGHVALLWSGLSPAGG